MHALGCARRLLSTRSAEAAAAAARPDVRGRWLFSSFVVGTGALSGWQAQRYFWKRELIVERTSLLDAPPRELADVMRETSTSSPTEYTRVAVTGRFDHDKEVLVGPRSPPPGTVGMASSTPEVHSGWLVFTPLHADGDEGGGAIINRGWVPRDRVNDIDRPTGAVRVEGVIREGEKQGSFTIANDTETGRFFWVDVPTMALRAELFSSVPPLVDAAPSAQQPAPPGTWPRPRPADSHLAFRVMPEMHIVYSVTWAALSAATAVMTAVRFWR